MATDAQRAPPCTCVIFGAAGSLTKRLLIPALSNLAAAKLLPDNFAIVGVARADMTADAFRTSVRDAAHASARPETADWLAERATYLQGDFDDPSTYERLADHLDQADRQWGTCQNRLFYLATPPSAFSTVAGNLGRSGLSRESGDGGWRRIIVEKPFGTDLASAQTLNRELLRSLTERQIYRIDHYLGKETVQNLMVLRFANGLFEPLWNREHIDHIDHIQITVAESAGVGTRGNFYDATGALRDMVPNHLFQLLTLTAMEPPTRFEADAVRTEKAKVLDAVQRLTVEDVACDTVRGQYGSGKVGGADVKAYRHTPHVAADSTTETFVALRLTIDNWRWAGVPFYLRTGKALAARKTEIAVQFKPAPFAMFRSSPIERLTHNVLVVRIQPDEGIALQFNTKVPGMRLRADGVRMDFKYADCFATAPSTGYETLLYDCMCGDATLFQTAQEIEAGWRIVQPILDAWRGAPACDFPNYPAGTLGPPAAEALLARDGRRWHEGGDTTDACDRP
ncbi:MAG: glucose-6-phosphate dehydrogenase [Reyranella sp.]|jgi:glucose-6-phosphate 1-dehydrogenase|nr:glucose-6-phosphate dehydrogenase [Reyranella sp.]